MRLIYTRPTRFMFWLGVACLLAGLAAAWMVLQEPWLGIRLQVSDAGDRVVVAETDPRSSPAVPRNAQVLRIGSAGGQFLNIETSDLIEEPDFFDTYAAMEEFFNRQSAIASMLRMGVVTLVWRDENGNDIATQIHPRSRTLSSIPAIFWFQLGVGFTALLMAAWIFVLRPDYWGARLFALTGLAFPLFTVSAAIYSSRELALPGGLFRVLSSINHAGALAFGCALVGLFLMYPKAFVRPRTLVWLPAIFGLWFVADAMHWAPDQNWGSRLPVLLQLLLAIGFGLLQWRSSRHQPLDRAALRWFALSSLVGCSLFVMTVYAPKLLGWLTPLPQAYAFGFFLFMYVGIALGLRKYRLFDLDEWAYRVLLWLAGALAVVAMDTTLLYLGLGQTISLGATLLLCGGLYFPFRQWLWQRLFKRRETPIETLLPRVSRIAFSAGAEEQQVAWAGLLRQLFDPLEALPCHDSGDVAEVLEDGLLLYVPHFGRPPAYALRFAGHGARLFSSRDAQFATALCHLMAEMMSGRISYEQGVTQERLRIGRDLHDNIGARLLKLIHQLRGTATAEVARDAMKDLRTAIAALDTHPVAIPDALADWRAEAEGRCEAAGCQLQWQQPEQLPALHFSSRTKAALEAVMRELITNALKHARPRYIAVDVRLETGALEVSVSNNGDVSDPLYWKDGYGLRNIRGRLHDLGGQLSIAAEVSQVRLTIVASLA